MAILISCPNCQFQFEPGEAFMKDFETQARQKMTAEWQRLKSEVEKDKAAVLQQKETLAKQLEQQDILLNERLEKEKQKMQEALQESITKSVASDYENKIKMLTQSDADNQEKLKEARKKELEFLQKEQALKTKQEEMELEMQKRILAEREKMTIEIRDVEKVRLQNIEDEYKMKLAEKEKQLEDQKKLADEMRRKAEQGSMQLQGEVQELLLEDILRTGFPHDKIVPVGKGVRGADCIQIVCNPFGNECGKIIFESKRTKDFGADWIEKLKADMRSQGADIAVIVSHVFPKDMDRFGEKDGVYICSFSEVKSLVTVLRIGILKVYTLSRSQENKGDKMHLLYDYLTSNEFAEQWSAIREGFMAMRIGIQKERDTMERLWKAREKQLEKVMLNAAHIRGSIEGIAGADAVNLSLQDEEDTLLLE